MSFKSKHSIPCIKNIILFSATKGGVGKSTTATNVAIALAKLGYATGIVDADIYGPTVPKLLGVKEKPEIIDNKMLPIKKHGIYSISMGYLIDESQATIWRGPMASKALYQLLLDVKWPDLDYLIVDMPPGTGDIYLTLATNFIIQGVILVTTPQQIAMEMLKKSICFFEKTDIAVIGVVENMSFFCDEDGKIHHPFGKILTQELILEEKTILLEQIGLSPKIAQFSDAGLDLSAEAEFSSYNKIAEYILSLKNN